MTIQAIVFDAYGTLFDVYSIAALGEKLFSKKGTALTELWDDKQIEYTRLRTMCPTCKPFWADASGLHMNALLQFVQKSRVEAA